jgi:hypothetical protein
MVSKNTEFLMKNSRVRFDSAIFFKKVIPNLEF